MLGHKGPLFSAMQPPITVLVALRADPRDRRYWPSDRPSLLATRPSLLAMRPSLSVMQRSLPAMRPFYIGHSAVFLSVLLSAVQQICFDLMAVVVGLVSIKLSMIVHGFRSDRDRLVDKQSQRTNDLDRKKFGLGRIGPTYEK